MPRIICKVNAEGRDYYFEFSTVVDAPVNAGMSLEEFTEYYREEYGRRSMEFEFPNRMKRVEEQGTSSTSGDSLEDLICCNRAGKDETRLTVEQLIDAYCVHADWVMEGGSCPIVGKSWEDIRAEEEKIPEN